MRLGDRRHASPGLPAVNRGVPRPKALQSARRTTQGPRDPAPTTEHHPGARRRRVHASTKALVHAIAERCRRTPFWGRARSRHPHVEASSERTQPATGKIAVKVINDDLDEVMKVFHV